MDVMIDTRNGRARLLDFLAGVALPRATLLELTGDAGKAKRSRFSSGLEERVAEAWVTPLNELTCGMCRMLVGQRFGLQWISAAAAVFVTCHPRAECDLYPGDLSVNSLIAWRELLRFAPAETMRMVRTDFDWLMREAEEEDWDFSIVKQAAAALREARVEIGTAA